MKLLILVLSIWFTCVCSYDEYPDNENEYLPGPTSLEMDNQFLQDDTMIESSVPQVVALIPETGEASFLGQVVKAGFMKSLNDQKQLCSSECKVPSVTFQDTGSSPSNALTYFKRYYSQGVRTFIGLVTSDEAKMVAEYASRHATDAILFSPTSTATELCQYKQLYRLTMDDRGYAEVLFDLAVRLKGKKDSTYYVQVIHRSGMHGNGHYTDISARFGQAAKQGYKVLSPISYNGGSSLTSAKVSQVIQQLLKSQAVKEPQNSMIALVGFSEASRILQEAAKHSSLKDIKWVLSDALTLSNIQLPDDMNVYGLGFFGDEAESKLLNKERNGLNKYLLDKKLPPMIQAHLAYDVITMLHKVKSLSQYISNTVVIEGLTGPLELNKCRERFSGTYVYAISPKRSQVSNIARTLIMQKWMVISHFTVKSSDLSNRFTMAEDYSPKATMEAQHLTKKGVTSQLGSPTLEIKKSEFLNQLVKIGDKNCEKNAQVIVKSKNELTGAPVSTTYTVSQMPESLIFPSKYGFILIAKCRTGKGNLELTRVCPPTKIGGTEISCQTKISNKALGKVNDQGVGCIIMKVFTGLCIAHTAGCFVTAIVTAGAFAPVCGAIGTGCGALGYGTREVCSRGKFVCTELFRQGLLSPDLMLADMSFAKHYSVEYPITRKGYDIVGPVIASWMKSSKFVTDIVKDFAIPWAEEMAYQEGYRETGNEVGALVMKVGSVICALVGGAYIYSYYIIGATVLMGLFVGVKKAAHIKSAYATWAKKMN